MITKYEVGNPGPGLEQTQNCGSVKWYIFVVSFIMPFCFVTITNGIVNYIVEAC